MGVWGDIPTLVNVGISPKGDKRWNGSPISEKDFALYIKDAASVDPQPVIVVVAQPGTTVATLLPVLEQLQRAGVRKVKIADH
jgi:biopolymer transport protein ExbD